MCLFVIPRTFRRTTTETTWSNACHQQFISRNTLCSGHDGSFKTRRRCLSDGETTLNRSSPDEREWLRGEGTTQPYGRDRLGVPALIIAMEVEMFSTVKVALVAITLFFCSSVGHAQQTQTLTQAVQLIGLAGLHENTKGNLTVINGTLHFTHSKGNADVAATSIENVVAGTDSQRAIGGTVGTLTQLAPYGSGRVLSLFRTKLDTLTIQFRDADGGLHGVIFTVPLGKAEMIKQEIIAQGAHTSIPTQADPKKTASHPKE